MRARAFGVGLRVFLFCLGLGVATTAVMLQDGVLGAVGLVMFPMGGAMAAHSIALIAIGRRDDSGK